MDAGSIGGLGPTANAEARQRNTFQQAQDLRLLFYGAGLVVAVAGRPLRSEAGIAVAGQVLYLDFRNY